MNSAPAHIINWAVCTSKYSIEFQKRAPAEEGTNRMNKEHTRLNVFRVIRYQRFVTGKLET